MSLSAVLNILFLWWAETSSNTQLILYSQLSSIKFLANVWSCGFWRQPYLIQLCAACFPRRKGNLSYRKNFILQHSFLTPWAVCQSCQRNLELWAFLFHFPVKDSSYSKDEQEHVKYSTESDRAGAECDTCSKATEVVKGTISLADTWWGAVLRQSWPVEVIQEFLCRNETYFLLNFIQLRFFFLQAELYSSRNSSGNLHPGWPWGTAHEERDTDIACVMTEKTSQHDWLSEAHYLLPADDFLTICSRGAASTFSSEKLCGSGPDQGFQPSAESQGYTSCNQFPQANPLNLHSASSHRYGGRQDPVLNGSKSINQFFQACIELLCTQPCW